MAEVEENTAIFEEDQVVQPSPLEENAKEDKAEDTTINNDSNNTENNANSNKTTTTITITTTAQNDSSSNTPTITTSAINSIINRIKKPEQSNTLSSKISNILSKSSVANSINTSIEKHRVSKVWHGVVNVAVIEATNLTSPKNNSFPDPFVRLKLGIDKFRTKAKIKTLNPKWTEDFDLYMYEDVEAVLVVSVRNTEIGSKECVLGECSINLDDYEEETTHSLKLPLNEDGATIFLLLTISSVVVQSPDESPSNNKPKSSLGIERSNFAYLKTTRNLDRVGCLQINILKAVGLMAADLRGTSDPYCVVQLDNSRLQTQTIYKTINPHWNRTFTMTINDIHSTLLVTILDENKNRKVEFLGMVAIPLLKIKNGELVWYQLKDCKLLNKVKGILLLKIDYVYNPLRAAVRTFKPKELLHMQQEPKLKISAMKRNVERAKRLVMAVAGVAKAMQSCLSWESKPKSLLAYLVYCASVYLLELYMLPLILIIVIVKNFIIFSVTNSFKDYTNNSSVVSGEAEEAEEDMDSKEEKKSILEKFQGLHEVGLMVQEVLDHVMSLVEKIRNMFLWRTPWLTCLGLMVLIVLTLVLFLVPTRWILLLWGTRKFSKKLLDPKYEDTNELLNYLDRLQSDKELVQHKELQPDVILMANVLKEEKKVKVN